MSNTLQQIKNGIIFSTTSLVCFSVVYAAISWPSPPAGEVSGGKYSTRLVPIGAIQAFNLATCPVGWIVADGTNGTLDLRGEFLRGMDNGRGIDIGRTLGSLQRGSLVMQPAATTDTAVHTLYYSDDLGYDEPLVSPTSAYHWGGVAGATVTYWGIGMADPHYVKMTRPRNVAVLYCQKN